VKFIAFLLSKIGSMRCSIYLGRFSYLGTLLRSWVTFKF